MARNRLQSQGIQYAGIEVMQITFYEMLFSLIHSLVHILACSFSTQEFAIFGSDSVLLYEGY